MLLQILFGVGYAIYLFNQGEAFLASLSVLVAIPGTVSIIAAIILTIALFVKKYFILAIMLLALILFNFIVQERIKNKTGMYPHD